MNLTIQQSLQIALQHHQAGKLPEAEQMYRQVLGADPANFEAHGNLGNVLRDLGQLQEAERSFRQALALRPDVAELHANLGTTLLDIGQADEAQRCYEQALRLKPDLAGAHYSLGNALHSLGQAEAAERSYRQALALKPDYAEAHNNLGNILQQQGRLEDAERSYRQALAFNPGYSGAFSNLLLHLNYIAGRMPADLYAEHREFNRRFGPMQRPRTHGNSPDPERRLRIGYVSGDFRVHSVAFFIEPILAAHDRHRFEIFCYYNYPRSDAVTGRLRTNADHWRDAFGLADEALARLIHEDGIDILIDLSGHTRHNRLPVFARKPAPVQVTWLGYLNTTGLDAMDYRITDARAAPEGPLDAVHSEKLVRLPDSQWCYRQPAEAPGVSPPPSAASGRLTFATFGNPAKIGQPLTECWGRLLARVPGSRLLVVSGIPASVPHHLLERLSRNGIADGRVELLDMKPLQEYLALHCRADIILDTFPYSGGTTTCHALWMGVPVVSLAGDTATSRGGASLLHAVGLDELIAQTPEQYIEIATALASDAGRLAALRAGMRERMKSSPLMDETRFARNLEQAYRTMWQAWCKIQQP